MSWVGIERELGAGIGDPCRAGHLLSKLYGHTIMLTATIPSFSERSEVFGAGCDMGRTGVPSS